jgi:thioredoxin 1
MIELNKDNFNSFVKNSSIPVLVDFWAPWCGPCKAIAPQLQDLSEKYNGQVSIVKVNVDNEEELAVEYRIQSIPTLLMFKNGEIVDKLIGTGGNGKLQKMIESVVAP